MGTSIAGPTKSSGPTSGAFGSAAHSRRAVAAAVALVASVLGFSSPAAAQSQPFTDISQDAYYSEAVGALTGGGVFDGTECAEGMLCPGEPIDRKTMAVWTVRVLDGQDPAQVSQKRFSDVQRPPTSADDTSVNTLRPAPAPAEPPRRTVSSIAVPASNNPASVTVVCRRGGWASAPRVYAIAFQASSPMASLAASVTLASAARRRTRARASRAKCSWPRWEDPDRCSTSPVSARTATSG